MTGSGSGFLRITVEADSVDEDALSTLLSDSVGGTGIEILDHRAAELCPEVSLLAPGRIFLRIYTQDPDWNFDFGAFPTARLGPIVPLEDDWRERWKDFFHASRVTDRLVVRPPWEPMEGKRPGDLEVVIEPGMAFGTGTHETTRLCLKALDRVVREGVTVLDVGCGSGVLSIAAAKLGAVRVVGIDIEQESLDATLENAAQNGVASRIEASLTPLDDVPGTFDIVAANILSSILLGLRDALVRHTRPGGVLLLSGIPDDDRLEVLAAFTEGAELTLGHSHQLSNWVALELWRPE